MNEFHKTLPETNLLTSPPVTWYDRVATWIADRCSPILVKECRQALKSRQFFWTFLVLLLAAVVWSFWGLSISLQGGGAEPGPILLIGYIIILGFPLGIVVPFGCFRSLAREFEDDTLQLLTITTMAPYQIINGKLVGAGLQLFLYLSAVIPCIAFTYLLRGVDISQIATLTLCSALGSIALAALGLMLAGMSRSTVLRVVLSLILIVLLLAIYLIWSSFLSDVVNNGYMFGDQEWLTIVMMGMTSILSTGWLCYHTAAALISFPADNRSTRLRGAMMVQHGLLVATILLPILMVLVSPHGSWLMAVAVLSAHYWLIMGSLTAAENPGMSLRVRRELPRTLLGQAFTGLLMPGPGRGYLFALSNLWSWTLVLAAIAPWMQGLAEWGTRITGNGLTNIRLAGRGVNCTYFEVVPILALNACYATFYLSITTILIRLIRGQRRLPPAIGLLVLALVFALVQIGTYSLHNFMSATYRQFLLSEFSIYLTGNWWWQISAVMDGFPNWDRFLYFPDAIVSAWLLASLTAILTALCLIQACRELTAAPSTVPDRVLQEQKRRKAHHLPGESMDEIFAARQ